MYTRNVQELLTDTVPCEHKVLGILGKGGEGIVYLVLDISLQQKFVVKEYFKPHERVWSDGLLIYEQKVNAPELGLPKITLLGDAETIRAVKYPHTQLHKVHWRILKSSEVVATALFRAFCKMQYYLMSRYEICLLDSTVDNFMMDDYGRFHYIDFGWLIQKINHSRSIKEGKFGYAVAMLLLEIFHKNIKHTILPFTGYSYDESCIYFDIQPLNDLGEKHAWVKDVLEKVHCNDGYCFLRPEFYLELSEGLPDTVTSPWLVKLLGTSMRFVRNVTSAGSYFQHR